MKTLIPQRRSASQRPAFTLMELVFVIVILGILAALAIPRLDRDIRQEAADNILSAIRYTRLMALTDDKSDPGDANWQQEFWSIQFYGGSDAYYRIGTDTGHDGSISKTESAIDPADGKYFFNSSGAFSSRSRDESPMVFLGHKYGINAISPSQGCNKMISFDHMGRPHTGLNSIISGGGSSGGNNYATYMNTDCNLTFSFRSNGINDLIITIEKQTGRAYIVGQPDS